MGKNQHFESAEWWKLYSYNLQLRFPQRRYKWITNYETETANGNSISEITNRNSKELILQHHKAPSKKMEVSFKEKYERVAESLQNIYERK